MEIGACGVLGITAARVVVVVDRQETGHVMTLNLRTVASLAETTQTRHVIATRRNVQVRFSRAVFLFKFPRNKENNIVIEVN